jgi:hypothetical protein
VESAKGRGTVVLCAFEHLNTCLFGDFVFFGRHNNAARTAMALRHGCQFPKGNCFIKHTTFLCSLASCQMEIHHFQGRHIHGILFLTLMNDCLTPKMMFHYTVSMATLLFIQRSKSVKSGHGVETTGEVQ